MPYYKVKLYSSNLQKGYYLRVYADNQTQAVVNARNELAIKKNVPNNSYLLNVSCEQLDEIFDNDIFKTIFGGFKK